MLTLYVQYIAKPNSREDYLRAIKSEGIQTAVRAEDGCLRYDYYLSTEDENVILLIEQWESEEHQRVHLTQPHMARLRELKAEHIESTTLGKVTLQ